MLHCSSKTKLINSMSSSSIRLILWVRFLLFLQDRSCRESVHQLLLQHDEIGSSKGRNHLHAGTRRGESVHCRESVNGCICRWLNAWWAMRPPCIRRCGMLTRPSPPILVGKSGLFWPWRSVVGSLCRVWGVDDDLSHPNHEIPKEMLPKLRYYSKEIHEASFVLPEFARKELMYLVWDKHTIVDLSF